MKICSIYPERPSPYSFCVHPKIYDGYHGKMKEKLFDFTA